MNCTKSPVDVAYWLKYGHSFIFDDYKLAVDFADSVNASEKKKIDDYNKKYNTTYEYPDFSDDKNDKKEKRQIKVADKLLEHMITRTNPTV